MSIEDVPQSVVEAVREVPNTAARTCCGWRNFIDPMLRAAAASGDALGADTLRWMGYADQELARLREAVGLPTRPPYSLGRPDYGDACAVCGGSGRGVIAASNGGPSEVVRCWPCEGTGRKLTAAQGGEAA